MPEQGEPIGSARLDLHANLDPLKADLEKAKAVAQKGAADIEKAAAVPVAPAGSSASSEVERATTATQDFVNTSRQMDESVRKTSDVAGGFKNITEEVHGATRQVGRFFGIFASIAGITASMFALGKAIRETVVEALKTGTDKAKEFTEALDLFNKTDSIDKLKTKLSDLNAELALMSTPVKDLTYGDALQAILKAFAGERIAKIKDEIADLNAQLNSLQKNLNTQNGVKTKDQKEQAALAKLLDQEHFERIQSGQAREVAMEKTASEERKAAREQGEKEEKVYADRMRREREEDIDYRVAKEEEYAKVLREEQDILQRQLQIRQQINAQAAQLFGADNIVVSTLQRISDQLDVIASQRQRGGL